MLGYYLSRGTNHLVSSKAYSWQDQLECRVKVDDDGSPCLLDFGTHRWIETNYVGGTVWNMDGHDAQDLQNTGVLSCLSC